jgi:hypothetical protein
MNICSFFALEEQREPVIDGLIGICDGRNGVGLLPHTAVHYYVFVIACNFYGVIHRADRNDNFMIPLGRFPAILMNLGLITLVIVFYDEEGVHLAEGLGVTEEFPLYNEHSKPYITRILHEIHSYNKEKL